MSAQRNKTEEPTSRRARIRRKLETFYAEHVAQQLRDVVMYRELSEEKYEQKTTLRVVDGDRQAVKRFCLAHDETRRQWGKCKSYLDNGYHALMAEVDGEIVGHIWWHDDSVARRSVHPHLIRYGLELGPGQVWGFDLYLLPDHRGRGASNDYFALFRAHLRQRGYTRVYGHVDASNTPAVWLHKLQGYRKVKAVEAQLYGHAVLRCEGRFYLRNPPLGARQSFDFRTLW
jgi:GNAT superfamily N-acetyltransferase